ncbi:MAG: hypothetical protein EOO77_30470 [Oxalobacteraceae bacterium]|nr:MAG: hypothetical protein EOO77_30470 [Oxalobacteraceae bacterium]
MTVRVLFLRHQGVELPMSRPDSDWIAGSIRLWVRDRALGEATPVLELNEASAAPGMAVLGRLYAPVIEGFDPQYLRFRGIESVRLTPDGPAVGVVQAWRIELGR